MDWKELIDRFQFNDQLFTNQQINAVSAFDSYPLITDRQHALHHARHTPLFQLDSKTRLIGRFEQTRPQGFMYPQSSIDYAFGQIIQFFWNFLVHLGALGVPQGDFLRGILVVRFDSSIKPRIQPLLGEFRRAQDGTCLVLGLLPFGRRIGIGDDAGAGLNV